MIRRGLLIGGLGLSLTMAGAAIIPHAVAQDDTTSEEATTETTTTVDVDPREAMAVERAARAEEFLARFTANLGLNDPAAVETALKETLKEMVDEEFAAGEISANLAEELKTRIDDAESVLGMGFGGPGFGGPGLGGRFEMGGGPGGPGGRGGPKGGPQPALGVGEPDAAVPAIDSTEPETLPTTDEAEATPGS